ncbi:streptophobe family protein [Streptomyces sp. N50]|uniref:streptophobe family protein n=1 Tax=Streptomyces sp. N50 TaxID=3081765 RepID=UPI0029621490|nr:streptophobe family protein [Streptomyces sp. N50]WOX16832.1 streptophobe family protein [Streptomyces sp. N50]
MTPRTPSDQAVARHGWLQALGTVLAGVLSMALVSALGLWAAGATDLPDGAFPRVVTATVVTAVGGTLKLTGNAGSLADTKAGLTVIPLSVTLTGALTTAAGFLRPLRHRAVASAAELAGWAARVAVLWLLALIGLALGARQKFSISLGTGTLGDIGDLLGTSPEVGFEADMAQTVLFGLLWLAGVLILALLVSPGAPLPARLLRFHASVRPAAFAVVALLLTYVALGVVLALVVAATRGEAAQTFALILLGMPNLVWLALTIGLGATWNGRVDGPFGLPVPRLLNEVLRTPDVSTLNLRSLAAHDNGVWWLLVVNAVLLLSAAFLMAARSPARVRAWQHAVHLAIAFALAVLMICLIGRISAHYGLSLLGIGDVGGGLSGDLFLKPEVWSAVGLAAVWGLVAGFLGALLARPVHRRGEVEIPAQPQHRT